MPLAVQWEQFHQPRIILATKKSRLFLRNGTIVDSRGHWCPKEKALQACQRLEGLIL